MGLRASAEAGMLVLSFPWITLCHRFIVTALPARCRSDVGMKIIECLIRQLEDHWLLA